MSTETPGIHVELSAGPAPAPSAADSAAAVDDVTFTSGAKRSEVKPHYSAIPGESLRRVALRALGAPRGTTRTDAQTGRRYGGGALTYGYGNWAQGLPFEDTFNHLIEHLYHWKEAIEAGAEPQDDDLAAAAWAILMPLMTFEAAYAQQFAMRDDMVEGGEMTPAEIDHAMRLSYGDKAYLLHPLAVDGEK